MGNTTIPVPTLWFDGECRSNPGLAVGGYRLLSANGSECQGTKILECASLLEAEYTGLIIGLQKAISLGCRTIRVRGNSNDVINQVNGLWAVRNWRHRELNKEACDLLANLEPWQITWVHRSRNQEVDWVCSAALNKEEGLPAPAKPWEEKGQPRIARMVMSPSGFKFKSWVSLSVPGGRDAYSSMNMASLEERALDFDMGLLKKRWPDATPPEVAKCYRWFLRARAIAPEATPAQLSEFAIHKCRVDMEVTQNAQKSRTRRVR